MLELQRKISVAQRDRDLGKVADLRYNALPEVQHRLEEVRTHVFMCVYVCVCAWASCLSVLLCVRERVPRPVSPFPP